MAECSMGLNNADLLDQIPLDVTFFAAGTLFENL